jgi:REP element-mobilizing transposase RayT
VFGKIVNGKMKLSNVGIIADILWYEIKNHAKNVVLHEFVVMPNHIHGIIEIVHNADGGGTDTGKDTDTDTACRVPTRVPTHVYTPEQFSKPVSGSIPTIVRSYKSAVTKHAHRLGFDFTWQSRFYENIIRDENAYNNISKYIKNNPLKWEMDRFNHHEQ